jgi:hypothetical protein
MLMKTLKYGVVLVCGVLALSSLLAPAGGQEKDKPALSGLWVQKGGELTMEFSGKDVVKISPHGDNAVIVIVCNYTIDKEGLVKAKITEFEGKDEVKDKVKQRLPIGLQFSFKWQIKDDSATLDDVKGDNVQPLKSHLEGKYEKK